MSKPNPEAPKYVFASVVVGSVVLLIVTGHGEAVAGMCALLFVLFMVNIL